MASGPAAQQSRTCASAQQTNPRPHCLVPESSRGSRPAPCPAVIGELPVVEFARGHTIYSEGELGDRLYIIVSGKVKLARRSPDGRHQLLTVVGPSDVFGAASTLDGGPRTASAAAMTEVCAVSMDRDAIHAWIATRPEAAEQLLALLARRFSCSMPAPSTSSRHLYTGHHQASTQAASWLTAHPPRSGAPFIPGTPDNPGFDAIVLFFRCVSSGSHTFVFSSPT